jgi:hypothetical protein
MHIENADTKLATFVKRAIAKEMAIALKEDRVNIDDDGEVVKALYDKTFSTISIAHLMDDARAIIRRGLIAAPPLFLAAIAAAMIFGGVVASGAMDPEIASVRKAFGKGRNEAGLLSRVVVVDRGAFGQGPRRG